MKNTTAIILLLISAGLYYTFISPWYGKVEARRAEAAQYKEILKSVEALSEKRDELLLKYNAIPKNELANLETVLPDNINTVELALDLDAIGSKYGVLLKSIKTVEKDQSTATIIATPTGAYEKVRVSFVFVSSYENFRRFIEDLERSMRIIEVRSVSFISNDDSALNEYKIEIETYWLR